MCAQAGGLAGGGDAHHARDVVRGDAVQRGLFLIDDQTLAGLIVLDVPIDIDDAVGLFEDVADLARDAVLALLRGPVDLGDQRLQHRRTGRHFGDLDAGVCSFCDRQQSSRTRLAISWLCKSRSCLPLRLT